MRLFVAAAIIPIICIAAPALAAPVVLRTGLYDGEDIRTAIHDL
jgi:hypothetical protein